MLQNHFASFRTALELEIDERLYVAALHLYHDIYGNDYKNRLKRHRQRYDSFLHGISQAHRHIMEQESQTDEDKNLPIARHHLAEHFGMERGEYLREHGHRIVERRSTRNGT